MGFCFDGKIRWFLIREGNTLSNDWRPDPVHTESKSVRTTTSLQSQQSCGFILFFLGYPINPKRWWKCIPILASMDVLPKPNHVHPKQSAPSILEILTQLHPRHSFFLSFHPTIIHSLISFLIFFYYFSLFSRNNGEQPRRKLPSRTTRFPKTSSLTFPTYTPPIPLARLEIITCSLRPPKALARTNSHYPQRRATSKIRLAKSDVSPPPPSRLFAPSGSRYGMAERGDDWDCFGVKSQNRIYFKSSSRSSRVAYINKTAAPWMR